MCQYGESASDGRHMNAAAPPGCVANGRKAVGPPTVCTTAPSCLADAPGPPLGPSQSSPANRSRGRCAPLRLLTAVVVEGVDSVKHVGQVVQQLLLLIVRRRM